MRKIILMILGLYCLAGCQSGRPMKPEKYIFIDTTGTAKQVSMNSLDEEIVSASDLYAYADTVLIGTMIRADEAENVNNERFRTPITISSQEVLKGEETSLIYMDGGRMNSERYYEEGIDDLIQKSATMILPPDRRKNMFFTIVPFNFADLEQDQIYLFFVRNGMIINGGYGVFEKQEDNTYINVITEEMLTAQQLIEIQNSAVK